MSNAIKVLHCIETMASGGVEQLKLTVSRYFDHQKFSQTIVCSRIRNNYDQRFLSLGIRCIPIGELKSPFNFLYYFRLIREVKRIKPDIIHGAVFEGVISAVVAGLYCRVPVIIIEETSEPLNRTWRGNLFLRLLSRFADSVLAISPSVRKYLIDVAGVLPDKVVLTNYAVDRPNVPTAEEVRTTKKILGLNESDFVIGSVGRLRDFHKRFSVLIRAMAKLSPQYSDIKLMIVGDGEDLEMLKSLAKSVGVKDKVIFAGYQTNTALYYGCMNVFALVSHMEAFGLVVVEAMYMRLPVIGTKVGGIKDIVVPNETGILIEPHDVDATAEAILKVRQSGSQLQTLGNAGYERAEKFFSAERYATEIQEIYQTLLARKKSLPR